MDQMITLILFVIAAIVLIVCAVFEKFTPATVLAILAGVYYHFVFGSVFTAVANNYQHIIPFVAGYVALGVIWSYIKWVLFLLEFKRYRDNNWKAYLSSEANKPYKNLYEFKGTRINSIPQASEYKSNIISWMCYWPISVIGTVVNDPIKKAFIFLYDVLANSYQRLANKIVPKIDLNDLEK